nr:multidrug effflux MFS transporter [Roseibium aquae]
MSQVEPPAPKASIAASAHKGMPFAEFVILIAGLMALNALAMDIMLPALPDIGAALNIVHENDRQEVLVAYLLGFGGAQLLFGPISDSLGRRTVLLGGLFIYALASIGCLFSDTLNQLLLARFIQGVGCAATRVVAVSIVRDCYSGRKMGKVMSLVMMIFMAVPIVAPAIGQGILLIADWHWIFATLLAAGLTLFFWSLVRLPETLPRARRQRFQYPVILRGYWLTCATRASLGYMLALTFIFGGLFAFITMSQQVFVDIFGLGPWFPLVFASIAIAMSVASYWNSRLVEAIGMRRLSHGATLLFFGTGTLFVLLASLGFRDFWLFTGLMAVLMACFGFIGANFNAMAMEPLGHIAGTASSVIGFVSTLGGAILGYIMGQQFDGTLVPLGMAFAAYGFAALLCILFAEKGRLFEAADRTAV